MRSRILHAVSVQTWPGDWTAELFQPEGLGGRGSNLHNTTAKSPWRCINRPAVNAKTTSRPVAARLGKNSELWGLFKVLEILVCQLLTDDTPFSMR